MLAVKSAHPNGMVSSTDSHRSSMGILKGKLQHTLSVAPSLLYYFSQYCGISFDESAELLKAGRLYAGGKPLQGLQALTVQVPMSIIPQLDLEVVTLDGHLVPAAQRQFHRYYGFMNLGSSTTVTTDEKEPRSFIFRVRKLSPTPLPPPRWTAPRWRDTAHFEKPSASFEQPNYYGDGLDILSSPMLVTLPGMSKGVKGLTILTNDTSVRPNFVRSLGIDGQMEVGFKRGTPDEAIEKWRIEADRYVESIIVNSDAEQFVKRSVQVVERPVNEYETSGPVRKAALVDTPGLPSKLQASLWALAPDFVRCTRLGPFTAEVLKDVKPHGARRMTDVEFDMFRDLEKRLKLQRVIAGLRAASET
jgi:hypothetical protein